MTNEDDVLVHYGILRRSGRYPWGSGGTPEQNHRDFLGYVDDLRRKGLSETEIARGLDITTTQYRALRSIAKNQIQKANAAQALRLKDKNMSTVAIGERMKLPESTVRSLLNPALTARRDVLQSTADLLRSKVSSDKYLDIGSGTENHLGISATKLATAVAVLREEGYEVRNVQVPQATGQNKTTIRVLAPPGTSYAEIARNLDRIKTVAAYSEDGGKTYEKIEPPRSIDSKRVSVRYAEDGGAAADGVIYVRPGVPDVSLGGARYAQVRIAVDDTHYLKGMAMYHDDLPPGKDLLFNTNKHDTGDPHDAMKPLKDDTENPFGTITRQRSYTDEHGNKQLSVMNIIGTSLDKLNEEGRWNEWSKTLSSQFLSKQSTNLARRQLGMTLQSKKDELEGILALTNPVVKSTLLKKFSDGADSAAVHLKAAALPGQRNQVLLPVETMSPNEVYAPNFRNGERVVLVRFPHGGTFEIPELTVNNRHPGAKRVLDGAADAVGVHPKVAERLSGADFDGDTVLVIPNNKGLVKTSPPLAGLKDFDPKTAYPEYPGMTVMTGAIKQQQMGDISNLITDMSIKGAKPEELARAVRHSMVVIDGEKHRLNYKQSYADNGIASLKEKYQGRGPTGRLAGASTVVSNSGQNAKIRIPDRRLRKPSEGGAIDPNTGKLVYVNTGESFVNDKGKTVIRTVGVPKLSVVDDVHQYSSGTPIEEIYANHANALKAMANSARKEMLKTPGITASSSARQAYAKEVASLTAKLNLALRNRPLERQAQLLANSNISARVADNPDITSSDLKKIKGQALEVARRRVGAGKPQIDITDREWEAIQAGAISTNRLRDILDNSNLDRIKELATPRATRGLTPVKLSRAKAMLDAGYTRAEVADALGVSTSTLYESLKAS